MSKKQIGSCLFLGCLMRPSRLSCTVSEFSYGCRRPSVQWHGRKVVTSWNCSQRGLWIIWSKNVLISGRRSSCCVFPNVFFERFERHRVPSHSREGGRLDYRWTNRRSTTGKRKNRCFFFFRVNCPFDFKNAHADCRRKPNFKPFTQTYFLRAAPGYDHLLHLILESVPESRFTGVSLRVFEATVRSNLRAENIRSWKKYWKINSFWWRHVIVLARCIAGKCDVLGNRLLLLLLLFALGARQFHTFYTWY